MRRGEQEDEAIKITLSDKNIRHFVNVIDKAKEEYQKEVTKREPELISDKDWNIPESIGFNENYFQEERRKSIMQPFYVKYASKIEEELAKYIENSRKIEWWFKNGDRDATYFAVPYDNGGQNPFYVDFIVKLKDGRIGLFDTKSGFTRQLAGPKVDGLFRYIQSENRKGKKLFGGIVTNTDARNLTGRWIYFDKSRRELEDNNFENWIDLEL
jgi:type III restriction enzyme